MERKQGAPLLKLHPFDEAVRFDTKHPNSNAFRTKTGVPYHVFEEVWRLIHGKFLQSHTGSEDDVTLLDLFLVLNKLRSGVSWRDLQVEYEVRYNILSSLYGKRLRSIYALLWPLVNIATFWKPEAPLVGTPLANYTKEDLLKDSSEKFLTGGVSKQYPYAVLVDVTEYHAKVAKLSREGTALRSGKNGDEEFAHIQVKTTNRKVLLNGRCRGAGPTKGIENLDAACWRDNNFTPVLVAWARREGIVLHVFGDKAYDRIGDLPATEPHVKFVVTGQNHQTAPREPGQPSNSIYEPRSEFRSHRGQIENSFHDQKVYQRFARIDRTSSAHLDEETTLVAVVMNTLLLHREHVNKPKRLAVALEDAAAAKAAKNQRLGDATEAEDRIPELVL